MVLAYVAKTYSLEVKDKILPKNTTNRILKNKKGVHIKFETTCSFNVEITPSILAENSHYISTDVKSLNYTAKNILERIKNINDIPNIIFEDEVLISALDKISRCSFYTNTYFMDKESKDLFGNDYERLSLIFNFHSIRELHSLLCYSY